MPHKYPAILRAFFGTPWAIWPPKLAEIRAFLALKAAGGEVADEEIKAIVAARRPDGQQMAGRVAVVPVMGVICHHAGGMEEASGGVSTERLGSLLDSLVSDKQCKSILMVFDSPGGAVAGVPELAEKIRSYRGVKKVYALADTMCASAAYWLASQCAEVACVPSGMVGSIGVLAAHEDLSAALEMEGVKTTLVSAGKYKGEGNPYEPLDDEARQEMQSKVDHYYGVFCADVGAGRGCTAHRVKQDMGQGRMLTPDQAKAAGMIDRIETVHSMLTRLGAFEGGPHALTYQPSMDTLQKRLDLAEED
jgi:capsid assembly protease